MSQTPDHALRQFLLSNGFEFAKLRSGKLGAQHNGRGVLVRWHNRQPFLYEILVRKAAGKPFVVLNPRRQYYGPDIESDLLLSLRGAAIKRSLITAKNLPPPFEFGKTKFSAQDRYGGEFFGRNNIIDLVRIAGFVAISDSGHISEEAAAIPGKDTWYHLDCLGKEGATFNLITNLEYWYPIDRRTMRVSSNLRPKKSVDLSQMGEADLELIQAAIDDWSKRTFGKS